MYKSNLPYMLGNLNKSFRFDNEERKVSISFSRNERLFSRATGC